MILKLFKLLYPSESSYITNYMNNNENTDPLLVVSPAGIGRNQIISKLAKENNKTLIFNENQIPDIPFHRCPIKHMWKYF